VTGLATIPSARKVGVHRATPADADALARLRWRWRTEEGGETAADIDQFVKAFSAWWMTRIETHHAFVAQVGEAPIGMAWLAVVDRIPGPSRWLRRSGNVQSVYVQPESRDAGVGTELLSDVVAHARALGLDYLSVHPSSRSFDLYRRAGFVGSGKVLELDLVER
jgi:GNAT superfamily N-acetyltransferase